MAYIYLAILLYSYGLYSYGRHVTLQSYYIVMAYIYLEILLYSYGLYSYGRHVTLCNTSPPAG